MNTVMRYDGYSKKERVDDLLDKILKYGLESINKLEKDFLDAHAIGNEDEIHNIIIKEESENLFEDLDDIFKFEYSHTEIKGMETHFYGILYVPDLEVGKNKYISGILKGKIVLFNAGQTIPDFFHFVDDETFYDVFEFCSGLEYELDNFLDYIISELKDKNK